MRTARGRFLFNRRQLPGLYLAAGVVVLSVLLQASLLARWRLLGAAPDLLLVVVVTWSLLRGLSDGLVWAFAGGVGLDLVAGLPLGTSSLALIVSCPLAELGKHSIVPGSLTLPALLVALATPLHGWAILFSQQLQGLPVNWLSSTTRVIGPEILLNVALVPLVFPLLRRLAVQMRSTQMEW